MVYIIAFIALLLVQQVAAEDATTSAPLKDWGVHVEGILHCNGKPAKDVVSFTWSIHIYKIKNVVLIDKDGGGDPDDVIANRTTTYYGNFLLQGCNPGRTVSRKIGDLEIINQKSTYFFEIINFVRY